MRKAKVAAIVCGVIASCLVGGFAVVDAATITLDDSSTADTVVYTETAERKVVEIAATVTSIESTAAATTSTTATTDSVMTETAATEMTSEASDSEPTTTGIKSIAIGDNAYVLPTVRETAPATETSAAKATVQTTVTTKTTTVTTKATTTTAKATTKATTKAAVQETTTVSTTKAPQTEETYTNPPMPELPVQTAQTPAATAAPATEAPTEAATQAQTETVAVPSVTAVSESDYILLCNAVAHEAGANSISETEKAKVVEVIMNRVYSPNYPNTVYGVLTQKYQFSGSSSYVDLGTYSSKVTDKVKSAVDLYFADPSAFNHGYLSFTGDGTQNYFK